MATYKLIQDVEAEDHILGPLTLRQFIFGLVAAFCWYLSFIIFVKHIYFLLAATIPPGLFCTFFAIPFGRDQPTEVWALAKLRFLFKPRRRIWDQSGVKELVTITVPKKIERVLTKGYSQSEVQSRLKALANTLDTRGWAIKNVNANAYAPTGRFGQSGSDRLIDIGVAPQEVPSYDAHASDDILDETSNPVAQQFQTLINQSNREHRQHIMQEMNNARAGSGQGEDWFVGPSRPLAYSNMRTLQPAQAAVIPQAQSTGADNGSTSGASAADPAILSLANNNDLNVSTLARQASKAKHGDEPSQDEVVISLH